MPAAVIPKHIFLDFDETLYDHLAFVDWIDDQLHSLGYLDVKGSFSGSVNDYHDFLYEEPLLRLYRHQDHMTSSTNKDWKKVYAQIAQIVKDQKLDFCYPDAHELLDWIIKQPQNVRILSFGDDTYQRWKMATCQHLTDLKIPIDIVGENKAIWLAKNHPKDQGILVDDKYPLKLPKNWHHIWINRNQTLTTSKKLSKQETQVNSLYQVREVIPTAQY